MPRARHSGGEPRKIHSRDRNLWHIIQGRRIEDAANAPPTIQIIARRKGLTEGT
jgi:hypothetical protein